jgi:hypothetical protein
MGMEWENLFMPLSRVGWALLFLATFPLVSAEPQKLENLALDKPRLASYAQSFAEQLTNLVGSEVVRQKSFLYSTRMRIRIGEGALKPIAPKLKTREIQSEIAFAIRGKDRPVWHELRKVASVDGRAILSAKKARERLAFGLTKEDDRARLVLLEEFAQFALDGIATDYGLSLLMFRPSEIGGIEFTPVGIEKAGEEAIQVFEFRREDQSATVTVFNQRQAFYQPIRGKVWVRAKDSMPVRLYLVSATQQDNAYVLDEGTIEYAPSRFGTVLPAGVLYTRHANGFLLQETRYSYSDYQKFSTDASLKFDIDP